ncbi:Pentatricopeptide repeat-containing protein [Nymphaea thermarum]|nr:Pentatricopeptide repeat-containing protein [Nymphaea thermarum]
MFTQAPPPQPPSSPLAAGTTSVAVAAACTTSVFFFFALTREHPGARREKRGKGEGEEPPRRALSRHGSGSGPDPPHLQKPSATIPIVRKTGGLADTVFDLDDQLNTEKANGFVFEGIDEGSLNRALERAFTLYNETLDHPPQLLLPRASHCRTRTRVEPGLTVAAAPSRLRSTAGSSTTDLGVYIEISRGILPSASSPIEDLRRAAANSRRRMLRDGMLPDKYTYPFLFKAFGSLARNGVVLGKSLHCHVLELGYALDLYVLTGTMHMYGQLGFLGEATKLFDNMPQRDVAFWTSLITCYAANDCWEEGLLAFNILRDDCMKSNSATLVRVMGCCAQLGALDQA